MTKDEIKKALKYCEEYEYCLDCICYGFCTHNLHNDALDLIIEQEKEIEQLNHENYELKEKLKQSQTDIINTIVRYCENQKHWNELKDCKLWGGKSDDLRNFMIKIFKEENNE